jgi:hypothetical protein
VDVLSFPIFDVLRFKIWCYDIYKCDSETEQGVS